MINRTKKIPIVKHLEDIDDLTISRDTGIIPGQKNLARKLADEIYKYSLENEYKKLIFTISSKKRAIETAKFVRDILLKKKSQIKIIFNIDENLREIDQGNFVLPSDYEAGDYFNGLKIAGKVFSKEIFLEEDNLTYQFGDFSTKDTENKYPELKQYFRSYGESYKDILLRFYNQAIKLSNNIRKLNNKNIGIVVFTHGQPHQIFTDLSLVTEKIKNDGYVLKKGDLPRTCWNLYKARKKGVIPFGEITYVSVENIYDENMIKLLKREIKFLENLKWYIKNPVFISGFYLLQKEKWIILYFIKKEKTKIVFGLVLLIILFNVPSNYINNNEVKKNAFYKLSIRLNILNIKIKNLKPRKMLWNTEL